MLTLLAMALLPLTAQTGGVPGPSEEIYKITLPGGEIRYGAVREKGQQVTVVYDEPWAPGNAVNFARSRITFELEPKVSREERLEAEGRRAGFVLRDTANGVRWISEEEVSYFDRAWAMLEAREPAAGVEVPPAPPVETASRPSLAAQFTVHAIVLVFGAALLALVLKTMLLKK